MIMEVDQVVFERLEPRLLLDGDPLLAPQYVDDGAAAFATSGTWVQQAGGYEADALTGSDPGGTATWTFSDLCPGYRYRVSVTWSEGPGRASDATFTITNHENEDIDTVLDTAVLDQTLAADDLSDAGVMWEDLGSPLLIRGRSLSVQLSGDADGTVVADAVRIERTGTWQPPIGVPTPEFGIEQSHWMYADPSYTYDYGSGPEAYRIGPDGPYTHYIDNTHPNATDSGNPLGTPEQPRLTIPWDLPAGSVAEIHGGPYTYGAHSGGRYWTNFSADGTAELPVFIRGTAQETKPVFEDMNPRLRGQHFIIENLGFNNSPCSVKHLTDEDPGTHHRITLRFNEVYGIPPEYGSGIAASKGHEIVVYGNHIHDNGDPDYWDENDLHGVTAGRGAQGVWILDNHIHGNGGDSIQINSGNTKPSEYARYVYIARNAMHEDGENAVDLKQCWDVIVTQNKMYGYAPTEFAHSGSDGTAMVVHYEPIDVWIMHNEIFDSVNGIRSNGAIRGFILGNVIHNIHHTNDDYDPSEVWASSSGIITWANPELHVVSNTMYDVDAGFSSPGGGAQEHHLIGNIIANLAEPAHHIGVSVSGVADASEMHHNLLYEPGDSVRIKWASSSTVYDLPTFQSTFGKGEGCIEADPLFVDAAAGDFRLRNQRSAPSPAIDAGASLDYYVNLFQSLYGLDIGFDMDGVSRPQEDGIDIGALEAINTPPVGVDDAAETDEDVAVTTGDVLANDTDAEEDLLSVEAFTQPAHGTVAYNEDGTFTYTPDEDWFGADSFEYTVSDGNGGSDTATVTVTVNSVNDQPVGSENVDALWPLFGTAVPPADEKCDINGDGFVTFEDAMELVANDVGTSMADTDLDRRVGILDLAHLATGYGQAGTFSGGDTNGDGFVDIQDLGYLANDYGKVFS